MNRPTLQICAWLSATLLVSASATAQGGGGWRPVRSCPQPCTVCPDCPSSSTEHTQPIEPQAEPMPEDQQVPPAAQEPADAMDSAFDQALTGQYDVASTSSMPAPNMIGDIFGSGGLTFTTFSPSSGLGSQAIVGPSPGSGLGIGRIKLMENTNILPQNRVFLGWEFFDSVPITAGGTDVNRFTPGIEKAFFNGLASVEVRMPFAATIDSTQDSSALGTSQVEFGNITIFLKSLLYASDKLAVGAGMTITTPTANDLVIQNQGTTSMRIENQAVHLGPYLGIVYMPGRFFSQLYFQYDVDANGMTTRMQNFNGQLVNAGRIQDTSVMFTSISAGYWVYQNRCQDRLINGIAPVIELHHNLGLGNGDSVTGEQFSIGDLNDDFNLLNLTFGSHFQIRSRTFLTLAMGVPLLTGLDRQFDYEFKVMLNHRFGKNFSWYRRTPASIY